MAYLCSLALYVRIWKPLIHDYRPFFEHFHCIYSYIYLYNYIRLFCHIYLKNDMDEVYHICIFIVI